jgi:hypothetical protein
VTLAGTIAEQDFAKLNWTLFYRKPPITLLFIVVLAIGLFYSTRSGLAGAGAILPWSPLLVPVGLYFMVTHNARRKYRASKILQSHLSYTLVNDGISVVSDGSEAVLSWDKFAHWQDTRRFLVLHSTQGQAFLVDKMWFEGDQAAMIRFTRALDNRAAPEDFAAPADAEG